MKSGIIRRVDQLGRIVLPMELRKSMRLYEGTQLELSLDGDRIVLTKYDIGGNIRQMASNIFDALPDRYDRLIVCDNERVVMTTKALKGLAERVLGDEVRDYPRQSFEPRGGEFCFDGAYPHRYISSILKDGDRLGFVVVFGEESVSQEMKDVADFVSGLIARQV